MLPLKPPILTQHNTDAALACMMQQSSCWRLPGFVAVSCFANVQGRNDVGLSNAALLTPTAVVPYQQTIVAGGLHKAVQHTSVLAAAITCSRHSHHATDSHSNLAHTSLE